VASCEEWRSSVGAAGGEQSGGGVTAAWCMEAQRWRRPERAVVAAVREYRAVRVQREVEILRAKAPAGVLAGGMTATSLDVIFPVGGVILEQQPCCTGFSR
jgi:hypothetical protein